MERESEWEEEKESVKKRGESEIEREGGYRARELERKLVTNKQMEAKGIYF